jgi:hypothetical protein
MARNRKWEDYTLVHDIWVNLTRYKLNLVKQENGCIEWQGPKHKQGYGFIGAIKEVDKSRLMVTTHRLAARLKLGRELRKGENVIHTCSNPLCCNPDHIEVGDLKLRNKVMKENGRQATTRKRKAK